MTTSVDSAPQQVAVLAEIVDRRAGADGQPEPAKAFRTLVDDGAEVSVETGLRAAEKLQSVLDGRERGTDVLELKVQLGRIGEAVRAVVPQSMWAAIVEKLEEAEQHPVALDVGEDGFDDADDDPYDPTEFIDDDDEF